MLQALGWEEGESPWCKTMERSPAAAYYRAREEGVGGAGTLGEESLWRPYMPPSHDWCVPPIHINIGKFHFRVSCQCGPAAVAKLQLPSCLDRFG